VNEEELERDETGRWWAVGLRFFLRPDALYRWASLDLNDKEVDINRFQELYSIEPDGANLQQHLKSVISQYEEYSIGSMIDWSRVVVLRIGVFGGDNSCSLRFVEEIDWFIDKFENANIEVCHYPGFVFFSEPLD
jgi:hypothetical protein